MWVEVKTAKHGYILQMLKFQFYKPIDWGRGTPVRQTRSCFTGLGFRPSSICM